MFRNATFEQLRSNARRGEIQNRNPPRDVDMRRNIVGNYESFRVRREQEEEEEQNERDPRLRACRASNTGNIASTSSRQTQRQNQQERVSFDKMHSKPSNSAKMDENEDKEELPVEVELSASSQATSSSRAVKIYINLELNIRATPIASKSRHEGKTPGRVDRKSGNVDTRRRRSSSDREDSPSSPSTSREANTGSDESRASAKSDGSNTLSGKSKEPTEHVVPSSTREANSEKRSKEPRAAEKSDDSDSSSGCSNESLTTLAEATEPSSSREAEPGSAVIFGANKRLKPCFVSRKVDCSNITSDSDDVNLLVEATGRLDLQESVLFIPDTRSADDDEASTAPNIHAENQTAVASSPTPVEEFNFRRPHQARSESSNTTNSKTSGFRFSKQKESSIVATPKPTAEALETVQTSIRKVESGRAHAFRAAADEQLEKTISAPEVQKKAPELTSVRPASVVLKVIPPLILQKKLKDAEPVEVTAPRAAADEQLKTTISAPAIHQAKKKAPESASVRPAASTVPEVPTVFASTPEAREIPKAPEARGFPEAPAVIAPLSTASEGPTLSALITAVQEVQEAPAVFSPTPAASEVPEVPPVFASVPEAPAVFAQTPAPIEILKAPAAIAPTPAASEVPEAPAVIAPPSAPIEISIAPAAAKTVKKRKRKARTSKALQDPAAAKALAFLEAQSLEALENIAAHFSPTEAFSFIQYTVSENPQVAEPMEQESYVAPLLSSKNEMEDPNERQSILEAHQLFSQYASGEQEEEIEVSELEVPATPPPPVPLKRAIPSAAALELIVTRPNNSLLDSEEEIMKILVSNGLYGSASEQQLEVDVGDDPDRTMPLPSPLLEEFVAGLQKIFFDHDQNSPLKVYAEPGPSAPPRVQAPAHTPVEIQIPTPAQTLNQNETPAEVRTSGQTLANSRTPKKRKNQGPARNPAKVRKAKMQPTVSYSPPPAAVPPTPTPLSTEARVELNVRRILEKYEKCRKKQSEESSAPAPSQKVAPKKRAPRLRRQPAAAVVAAAAAALPTPLETLRRPPGYQYSLNDIRHFVNLLVSQGRNMEEARGEVQIFLEAVDEPQQ